MKNEVYTDHEGFGDYTPQEHQPEVNTSVYNFVFHFNAYTGLWHAIPRDLYNNYWTDHTTAGTIRSKSIDTLLYLLYKTGGDVEEVYKITSGK
jgi:hypothetical protein